MAYPATLELNSPDSVARWRPLVAWLLAIPHFIVMWALGVLAGVITLVSWFVILFTGKLPEGLAGIMVMVMRYEMRVMVYAGFLQEDYPPFEFSTDSRDPGDTPLAVDIIPALEGRNRLTCALRFIWVIPAALFAFVIWIAASVVWIVAFFAVIILGRWPDGMRDFVVKAVRLSLQVNAYANLLTDDYPPFNLTDDAPASAATTPPPPPPPAATAG